MPAKITNLRAMQGLGILADRTSRSASLEFRQFNLIYGFNGSGKSTLSRIFASLEAGQLHAKLPAGSSFEVTLDDGTDFGCPTRPSGLERRVLVFNSDFIERNLQWSLGTASPVFFIGAEQAEAAAELARLEAELPELNLHVSACRNADVAAEKAIATFKRDRAKLTASRLHQGNRKYEAPQLTADHNQWASSPLNLLNDGELRAAEDTRRLAEAPPTMSSLSFDPASIAAAFRFVKPICEQSLSTVAMQEVQDYPDMLLWLKQGHEFHRHASLSTCLFCGNELTSERTSLLAAALDNQIDQFIERLARTADRLRGVVENLEGLTAELPLADAFAAELRATFIEARGKLLSAIQPCHQYLRELEAALRAKRERPASPSDTSALPTAATLEAASADLSRELLAVNEIVEEHNRIVAEFESYREGAGIAIRQHYIAEGRDEFVAHLRSVEAAKAAILAAEYNRDETRNAAESLRQQIKSHGPAAEAINRLIASYLGHQELSIHAIEEGYEIRRHGQAIEGIPSEGEKTAIAISYFLSTIESEGRKLKDLIIVVDDPVSSLDTRALNFACTLVRNRLSGACQLFILTHNQQCLNEFGKSWRSKARQVDGKEATATLLFIDVKIPRDGTKRVASLVKLSKLLREYESEYHFLFSHVLQFTQSANDHYDYAYMMPNVLRRVLDVFLAFKCPGGSGLAGKIEEICRQYPDLDRDRIVALERLAQVESHSDNLDDLIGFSSMTLEETKQATEALLILMEHVDLNHTRSLKRICG